MKKVFTVVFTMLVAAGLAFAQTGGGTSGATTQTPPKVTSGKKSTKTSKAHKGGKKHKKGSTTGASTAPAPK